VTMINGITLPRQDAVTQDVWIVKTSLQCLPGNISACRAHSVITALSCELTASTMINMTVPDLEKLIPTSISQAEDIQLWMQKKVLEVNLVIELHAWTDAEYVGRVKCIAKGDAATAIPMAPASTTDTAISIATEISTDTAISTAIQ